MTPGGGGWGDPFDRPVASVRDDVLDGFVSVEAARQDYGVVLDPPTFDVDEEATRRLRQQRPQAQGMFHRGAYFTAPE